MKNQINPVHDFGDHLLCSGCAHEFHMKIDKSHEQKLLELKAQLDDLYSPAKMRHMQEALEKCLDFFKGKASYSIPQLIHFCAHGLGRDDRE